MALSKSSKAALSKVLERSAATLADAIDASGKIVKENAKELATEVIIYQGYINGAFSILGSLVLAAFCLYGFTHLPEGEGRIFVQGVCTVASFASIIWFLCSVQEILKAAFAPRLFLVEYAASLLKSDEEKKSK